MGNISDIEYPRTTQAPLLETRLRKAVDAEQFVLHYQPKIDLASGAICGLEALIRWQDPQSGLVEPGVLIPMLEDTGLILEVEHWAIRHALSQRLAWHIVGLRPPRIAVNVSPIQLQQADFVRTICESLETVGVGAHGLDLEITESLILEDIEDHVEKLRAVGNRGVNIAIDDFGTGCSSFEYLDKLPVDALKVDRSLIAGLTAGSGNLSDVSTIISLAHSLNLTVTAEAVETEEQSQLLKLLKCDEAQGFLFSKPLPAAEIEALLRTQAREAPVRRSPAAGRNRLEDEMGIPRRPA